MPLMVCFLADLRRVALINQLAHSKGSGSPLLKPVIDTKKIDPHAPVGYRILLLLSTIICLLFLTREVYPYTQKAMATIPKVCKIITCNNIFSLSILLTVSLCVVPLRFKVDGTFQIAVFEDLHFAEGPDQWW